MKKWKLFLIAFGVLAGFFLLLISGIKSSKTFKVTHFAEVKSEVGVDGRAPVGSPEVYQFRASPAYTWEASKNYTGVFRTLAWLFIIGGAVFVFVYGNGIWTPGAGSNAASVIPFVILALAAACMFGAYTSAFSNNYVEVGKEKYEQIKNSPADIKALFDAKDLIR